MKLRLISLQGYQLIVSPTFSDPIEETITIRASRNNQMQYGTEQYATGNKTQTKWCLSYDNNNNCYLLKCISDDSFNISQNYFYFPASKENKSFISIIGGYHAETNKWIKLIVQTDDQVPIKKQDPLSFQVEVDYEKITMTNKEDTPAAIKLKFNEQRTETIYLGYDKLGLFSEENKQKSTKDEYVLLTQYHVAEKPKYMFQKLCYEEKIGQLRTTYFDENPVQITVKNVPNSSIEKLVLPVNKKNTVTNPAEIKINEPLPITCTAWYNDHSDEEWSNEYVFNRPNYDYDGLYEVEFDEWKENTPDDQVSLQNTIRLRKKDSGHILKEIQLTYPLETTTYQLQPAIQLVATKTQQKHLYNPIYQESADGLVAINSEYYESMASEGDVYQYFDIYQFLTKKAKEAGFKSSWFRRGYETVNDQAFNKYGNEFIYLANKQQGIYKKYPIDIQFDLTEFDPSTLSKKIFDFTISRKEFQTEANPYYEKQFSLPYSDYQSREGTIFIDRKNIYKQYPANTPEEERFIIIDLDYFPEGATKVYHPFTKINEELYQYETPGSLLNLHVNDDEVTEVLPTAIKVRPETVELQVGETEQLFVKLTPEEASNQTIRWQSADPNIASIEYGIVTGKAKGKTTITATTSNGLQATCQVSVLKETPPSTPLVDEKTGVQIIDEHNHLPKNSELRVTPVTDGKAFGALKEFIQGNLTLYDIKFLHKDAGVAVQPKGPIKVGVPIPTEYDRSKLKLFYYNLQTNKATEINGSIQGNLFIFETDHFSYYALVEENQKEASQLVDKKELQTLYAKALTLKETEYEKESWLHFSNVLAKVSKEMNNSKITQKEIDLLLLDLKQAIANLVPKEKPTTPSTSTSKESTSPEGTSSSDRPSEANSSTTDSSTNNSSTTDSPTNNSSTNNSSTTSHTKQKPTSLIGSNNTTSSQAGATTKQAQTKENKQLPKSGEQPTQWGVELGFILLLLGSLLIGFRYLLQNKFL